MDTLTTQYKAEEALGKRLIGRKAQSTILTEISINGNKMYQPQQIITGYEIVECFMEPTLMVIIGGESVFESTLFNIQ